MCGGEEGGERVWGVGVLVETHYWCVIVLGVNHSVEELHEWPKVPKKQCQHYMHTHVVRVGVLLLHPRGIM